MKNLMIELISNDELKVKIDDFEVTISSEEQNTDSLEQLIKEIMSNDINEVEIAENSIEESSFSKSIANSIVEGFKEFKIGFM